MRRYVLSIVSQTSYSLEAEAGAFSWLGSDVDLTVTTPPLNAGSIALTPGDGSYTVTQLSAPSGGTGSYTVTLYESTTSGQLGSLIATNPTYPYQRTGRTNDTTYYVTRRVSDGVSVVDSEQVGVTPSATPEIIWQDDFETDRLSSYFERSGFVRTAGAGKDGGYGLVATYTQSQVDAGSVKLAFGRTPDSYINPVDSGSLDYREIYYSFDVRPSVGFVSADGMKLTRATVFAASSWAQAMIAHVWAGNGAQNRMLRADPARGTDASGNLVTTGYNDFANLSWIGAQTGSATVINDTGEWRNVEVHIRLNDAGQSNGVFEVWVDGVLDVSITDLNWLGAFDAYGINTIMLEAYVNDGSPQAQSIAFDNLIVSTQRIGEDAPPELGTIDDLVATVSGATSVGLAWTAAENATSHQPQYRIGSGSWSDFGSPLGGSASGVTVTGLTTDTEYQFRVVAGDGTTTTTSNVDTATPTAGGGVAPLLVEDFSTYTSTADFINNPRGIYVPSEDYRLDRMTLDTSIGYGTSDRSLRYNYPAGTDTDYTISRALSIGSQQEVWVEAVVRFSTNFTTAGNGQGAGIGFKLLFVNIRDIPQGGRFGLHMEGSRLSIEGPNDDYTAMHVSTTLQIATLFDGNWHVLRYHVRLGATDFHELFYQGVSQGSASGNTSASELLRVSLARNLNMLAAQPQEMWWGRVSVWTTDPGWT